MVSPICTAMMAKLDELKDQMSDGAYLQLCNELMRHHRATTSEPVVEPVVEPMVEPMVEPVVEPMAQALTEEDERLSIISRARQCARELGRPDPFPQLP